MADWKPATVGEVRTIVAKDLLSCDAAQKATFKRYAVEPFCAPIVRYGKTESVVVVARRRNEVMYYEDVEEGFNVSPISCDGQILEHWCNQDELRWALNAWIWGRGLHARLRPAQPLN
ncbi:MAG TPA: hypothetical protein VD837_01665 [Terriglobales bacterium]|nr:hypothetical protein [Terriglobales bacterium]